MRRLAQLAVVLAGVALAFGAQAADKKIERLYGSKCGACHGKDGKGQTEKGKKLKLRDIASEEFQKITDEEMKKAVLDGLKREKDGVKQEMDSYKADIKEPEIDALVKYMREFKK